MSQSELTTSVKQDITIYLCGDCANADLWRSRFEAAAAAEFEAKFSATGLCRFFTTWKTSNDYNEGNGSVLKVYMFIIWLYRFTKLINEIRDRTTSKFIEKH